MAGMRLGGIDPSILRELSGVYKPFVKAFKELISNAFDADASHVTVSFADDFSQVTVTDDGCGMTPFEFRNDFTRIGGGSRRWASGKTRGGRLRIGSKGIGFLALARYCDQLRVISAGDRPLVFHHSLATTPVTIDILSLLEIPMDPGNVRKRLTFTLRETAGRRRFLKDGKDYRWNRTGCRLTIHRDVGPVALNARIDAAGLGFEAVLDFDHLLKLADAADLEKLDDFASIEVFDSGERPVPAGTTITAEKLKGFVRRELRADRRKGFVRNISSRAGYEQFLWALSRCTPITYIVPPECPHAALISSIALPKPMTLSRLELIHNEVITPLHRPLYPLEADSPPLHTDMVVPVHIDEAGVKAVGFLAGYESIIFPAEHRGISVRVRGVAIGDAGFLGADTLLTGPNKAALSQVTGEINVLKGLDAVDALNPGRESFYEESEHFKVLRRHIIGEGERVGGALNKVIAAVLRRSQVRSALTDVLGRATLRRRALEDISSAITHLVSRGDRISQLLRRALQSRRSHTNGLVAAKSHDIGFPPRIAGLAVQETEEGVGPVDIDYEREVIRLNTSRPEWSWSLLLFDRAFEVIHKRGQPDQPIGEVDWQRDKIFINWGHPVKLQMDERGFLRTALAWVLAKDTARKDPESMMELALHLLSFTTAANE